MNTKNPLKRAFERLGLARIAQVCEVSHTAAQKWRAQGHLPRTEWTQETSYAAKIAAAYRAEIELAPQLDDEPLDTLEVTRESLLALRPGARQAPAPGGLAAAAG